MSNIIDLIESEGIRKDIPDFQPAVPLCGRLRPSITIIAG